MSSENGMVDIHSHILPCMDDGSASVEESLRMIDSLSEQGVTTIAATPHFYAEKENPASFLERRRRSLLMLRGRLPPGIEILPGAEVYYYPGISQTEELSAFTIGSSRVLLVEMPFADWTSSMAQEILTLQSYRGFEVVLAHIERYIADGYAKHREELLRNGILFQVNAGAFLDRKTRGMVFRLLKHDGAQFVASDCHNMHTRVPRLGEAYDVIEEKFGARYVRWLQKVSRNLLEGGMPK